ncbi:MAG: hypothetical protein GXO07_06905 [Crenarchaeota archaeon]|nr:hypothetical protein [Thermoproteota archaeon]
MGILEDLELIVERAKNLKIAPGRFPEILESEEPSERKGPFSIRAPEELLNPSTFLDSKEYIPFDEILSYDAKVAGVDGGSRSVNVSGLSVGITPVAVSYEASVVFEHPHLGFGDPISGGPARPFFAYLDEQCPGDGPESLLFCPLINWKALAQSAVSKSRRRALERLTASSYNRPTALDENRLFAETRALEFALRSTEADVGIDGPIFPTPMVLATYKSRMAPDERAGSLIVVVASYLYNLVERHEALSLGADRAFGAVKRLHRSRLLAKNFNMNNDHELIMLAIKELGPGVHVWGPVEVSINLHDVAKELSEELGLSEGGTSRLTAFSGAPKIDLFGKYTLQELITKAVRIGTMKKLVYYVGIKGLDGRGRALRIEVLPVGRAPELVRVALSKTVLGHEVAPYPLPILHADQIVKKSGAILKDALVQKAVVENLPAAEVELP